mmetsp:Transcript_85593/g.184759  ORF Transcript_85593/g.184759 Transcript_85593/m.184759 type:complete len:625 (-) Transcript_85593:6-1880(-)
MLHGRGSAILGHHRGGARAQVPRRRGRRSLGPPVALGHGDLAARAVAVGRAAVSPSSRGATDARGPSPRLLDGACSADGGAVVAHGPADEVERWPRERQAGHPRGARGDGVAVVVLPAPAVVVLPRLRRGALLRLVGEAHAAGGAQPLCPVRHEGLYEELVPAATWAHRQGARRDWLPGGAAGLGPGGRRDHDVAQRLEALLQGQLHLRVQHRSRLLRGRRRRADGRLADGGRAQGRSGQRAGRSGQRVGQRRGSHQRHRRLQRLQRVLRCRPAWCSNLLEVGLLAHGSEQGCDSSDAGVELVLVRLLELAHHLLELHGLGHHLLLDVRDVGELCRVLHPHVLQLCLELLVIKLQRLQLLLQAADGALAPIALLLDLLAQRLGLAVEPVQLLASLVQLLLRPPLLLLRVMERPRPAPRPVAEGVRLGFGTTALSWPGPRGLWRRPRRPRGSALQRWWPRGQRPAARPDRSWSAAGSRAAQRHASSGNIEGARWRWPVPSTAFAALASAVQEGGSRVALEALAPLPDAFREGVHGIAAHLRPRWRRAGGGAAQLPQLSDAPGEVPAAVARPRRPWRGSAAATSQLPAPSERRAEGRAEGRAARQAQPSAIRGRGAVRQHGRPFGP